MVTAMVQRQSLYGQALTWPFDIVIKAQIDVLLTLGVTTGNPAYMTRYGELKKHSPQMWSLRRF